MAQETGVAQGPLTAETGAPVAEQERLIENLAGFIARVSRDDIAERAIGTFRQADEDFGKRLEARGPGPPWLTVQYPYRTACRGWAGRIPGRSGSGPFGLSGDARRVPARGPGPSSG